MKAKKPKKLKESEKPIIRERKLRPLAEQTNQEFYPRLYKLARSTQPADRELMETRVRLFYKALGKDEPHISWCDSPLQLFVIPYLIDRFGRSDGITYDELWLQAEEKYFSHLAPEILERLNLGALQNRLSTHFPLSGAKSYRPNDTIIDVGRALRVRRRSGNLIENFSGDFTAHPDLRNLANFYDAVNNRLWRDLNRPPLREYELLQSESDPSLAWYRDNVEARMVSNRLDEWVAGSRQNAWRWPYLPDTAVNSERWSAFLPEFDARETSIGFGGFAQGHSVYSRYEWSGEEEEYVNMYTLWSELIQPLWWLACYEHSVFLCERPVILTFDANERLHNEDGPAVSFKDGYGQHFWHGRSVPAEFIENEPTVKSIENEPNIEIRRLLIERLGTQEYLFATGAKVRNIDKFGTLYIKHMPGDESIVMVHLVNKTPEPDGSYKDYFLRVPPNMHSAQAAVAWTFGLDADSYKPIVET